MTQTVSITQSVKRPSIFDEKNKNRLFVLKESSHNETIFKQNLFDRRK